jgi:hypothetical protein
MNFSYRLIYTLGSKTQQEIELTNKCFNLWAAEFGADLASRGAKLNYDEFQRARVIAVICKGDEVAGFHLYSSFDLREDSSREHSYIRAIPDDVKVKLREHQINSFMAMEYLTVAPAFRSREAGGPKVAEMIIRLGLKVMNELGVDASVGIARVDRKVNWLGEIIGFSEFAQITKYNNQCAVMVFGKENKLIESDDFTKRTVDSLWNDKYQPRKIAA